MHMIYYVSECIQNDIWKKDCVEILTDADSHINSQESLEDCQKACYAIAECDSWVWHTNEHHWWDQSCELQSGSVCGWMVFRGTLSGWKC